MKALSLQFNEMLLCYFKNSMVFIVKARPDFLVVDIKQLYLHNMEYIHISNMLSGYIMPAGWQAGKMCTGTSTNEAKLLTYGEASTLIFV